MSIVALPRMIDAPVSQLKGICQANARRLARLDVATIRDLLLTLPYGLENFATTPISDLTPGAQASVVGRIVSIRSVTTQRQRLRLVEATLADDSGGQLRVVWFHSPWIVNQLRPGDRVEFAGVVEKNQYRGTPGMVNPRHELLDGGAPTGKVGGITPKYHLVEGLSSRKVGEWVDSVLPLADQLVDVLPAGVRERHGLLD